MLKHTRAACQWDFKLASQHSRRHGAGPASRSKDIPARHWPATGRPAGRARTDYSTPMISTLHWVPKGAAKAEPEQYELSSEDVQALQEKFSEQLRATISSCLAPNSTQPAASAVPLHATHPLHPIHIFQIMFIYSISDRF